LRRCRIPGKQQDHNQQVTILRIHLCCSTRSNCLATRQAHKKCTTGMAGRHHRCLCDDGGTQYCQAECCCCHCCCCRCCHCCCCCWVQAQPLRPPPELHSCLCCCLCCHHLHLLPQRDFCCCQQGSPSGLRCLILGRPLLQQLLLRRPSYQLQGEVLQPIREPQQQQQQQQQQ
jgi:hypothetical protein